MRRILLAGLAAGFCAIFGWAEPAAAKELITVIDLVYGYSQKNVGGDVDAATTFDQKYDIKYETSLTSIYDFLGAVRVELQDAWYTNSANTSRVVPTLEMEAKGSPLAAKLTYEAVIGSTDVYHESAETTTYSSGLLFDLQTSPWLWPQMKLKYQTKSDFQDYSKESTTNTYELTMTKDIYNLRLDYFFKREDIEELLPARLESAETQWSAKATYKELIRGGTEFELAYEISEVYKDKHTRGVFSGETSSYTQLLRTRLKNSLVITPRITLGLIWEYEYSQDLLALNYDYNLKNKFTLDLRWNAFEWLKINSEARRETSLKAALIEADDEQTLTDNLRAGFDLTSIPWLRVSGKAEFKSEQKIVADTGGSVDKKEGEKYELTAKNLIGKFWDLTLGASTLSEYTDDSLTKRETKVRADLKLTLLDLVVNPAYDVSRRNDWTERFDFPTTQQQARNAKISFDYQLKLLDMFRATFKHEYSIKVEDKLDKVLDFERRLQFSEDTQITIALTEIFRDLSVTGEFARKASDTEDDPDPQLVTLTYALKMNLKLTDVNVQSSIKYNDKGDAFDDVIFTAGAAWKIKELELTGEYQFDKVIKDNTEPKEEKRKLTLKLNYTF